MSDTSVIPEPSKITDLFGSLLIGKKEPNDPHGPLWYSWRYLQIYTHYGLKLPHTEADLKTALNISDPAKFAWFSTTQSAYAKIFNLSDDFLKKIFPGVVGIGTALERFARDAGGSLRSDDDSTFTAITELLDGNDDQAALELIQDLAKQAATNRDAAGAIKLQLAAYKADLAAALGLLKTATDAVNKDNSVSREKIRQLTSDNAEDQETLAGIQAILARVRTERQHNVVVAATTATYFWVLPFGLIAAAIVAGIFGSKAEESRKQIEKYEDMIKTMQDELRTAVSTHDILDLAQEGLTSANKYTELADSHATAVQNAWEGVTSQLTNISDKMGAMTGEKDGQAKLKARAVIKTYSRQARESWKALLPALHDLTDEPYIRVAEGTATFGQVVEPPK
jgi:hypothetical protein